MNCNPTENELKKWAEEHAKLSLRNCSTYPLDGENAKVLVYGTDDQGVEAYYTGVPQNWKSLAFKVYEETGLVLRCTVKRIWKTANWGSCVILRDTMVDIKLLEGDSTVLSMVLHTESRNDAFEKFRKIYRAFV